MAYAPKTFRALGVDPVGPWGSLSTSKPIEERQDTMETPVTPWADEVSTQAKALQELGSLLYGAKEIRFKILNLTPRVERLCDSDLLTFDEQEVLEDVMAYLQDAEESLDNAIRHLTDGPTDDDPIGGAAALPTPETVTFELIGASYIRRKAS